MPDFDLDILESALERCAEEPIHIPGVIQNCGVLLAFSIADKRITYASENVERIFGQPMQSVLGTPIDSLFDSDFIHEVNNCVAQVARRPSRVSAGSKTIGGTDFHVSVSPSDEFVVLEFESEAYDLQDVEKQLRRMPLIMNHVQNATSSDELLKHIVNLSASLSGYDRVMAYRFDATWNGEVIAEHAHPSLEPYLGLHFPHWDIPSQARDMMLKFPLRFIADVDSEPVPIRAMSEDQPPLDISLAQLRGVSPIHHQYLRNMGVQSTMTMSIIVEEKLWGIISFHNREAMVPPVGLRQVCTALAPLIGAKLESLLRKELLDLHKDIDVLSQTIADGADAKRLLVAEAETAIEAIYRKFDVVGVAIGIGEQVTQIGINAPQALLDELRQRATSAPNNIWQSQCLVEDIDCADLDLGSICGALMLDRNEGKWICLLRESMTESIRWAGAPNKSVDTSDGRARLHPRGSFTLYKETQQDTSRNWQNHDMRLLEGISQSLLAANQRQIYLAAMQRQQGLIVDELNHRVRNILALVRSISRQARRHNASLESYSAALEQRINALASAHDLGVGDAAVPVSVKEIIAIESAPFSEGREGVVDVVGSDIGLSAENAPIVALVIHELMTNAAKYGALSIDSGHVNVFLSQRPDGAVINWMEMDGPTIQTPEEYGFGTTLISNAVPYELNGTSELIFHPTGVIAKITLPTTCLATLSSETRPKPLSKPIPMDSRSERPFALNGSVLIVEDNYMIALDLMANLKTLGFQDVEMASDLAHAREIMTSHDISLAILDINLGRGGTSVELADELDAEETPFIFVTGYGELAPLPTALGRKIKLQKPVSVSNLKDALNRVFQERKAM